MAVGCVVDVCIAFFNLRTKEGKKANKTADLGVCYNLGNSDRWKISHGSKPNYVRTKSIILVCNY